MNVIQRYVDQLTDLEKQQLIADYEEFAAKGFLGDCALRRNAQILSKTMGDTGIPITSWMTQIANACYQYFATLYIKGLDDGK